MIGFKTVLMRMTRQNWVIVVFLSPRNDIPRRAIWHESLAAFLLDAVDDEGFICNVRRLFKKVRQMHEAWTVGDRNERRLVGAAGFEPATPIPPE